MQVEEVLRKQFIYYHDPCLDGLASAFLIWLFSNFNENDEYQALSYTAKQKGDLKIPFDRLEKEASRVVFVDFVPNESDLIEIHERLIPHIIIDHHKTAIETLDKLEKESGIHLNTYLSRDNNLSGCGLVLKWYNEVFSNSSNTEMVNNLDYAFELWEYIFKYIQDRDLWTWKFKETEKITEALWSYDCDLSLFKDLFYVNDLNKVKDKLLSDGEALNRFKNKTINLAKRAKYQIQVGPYIANALNSNVFQSELGHELCRSDNVDFAVIYTEDAYGNKRCSLRSENDFDCSKIAKFFGGGGHPQACGCSVKDLKDFNRYKE